MSDKSVSAEVKLRPVKSQTFLVTLAVVGALCWLWAFGMLRESPMLALVPLACGAATLATAAFGWFRSQRDTDRHGGVPTVIEDLKTGLKVSTDMRSLSQVDISTMFRQTVESMTARRRLPDPDGMVDQDLQPIRNSREQAMSVVAKLNAKIVELDQINPRLRSIHEQTINPELLSRIDAAHLGTQAINVEVAKQTTPPPRNDG